MSQYQHIKINQDPLIDNIIQKYGLFAKKLVNKFPQCKNNFLFQEDGAQYNDNNYCLATLNKFTNNMIADHLRVQSSYL